MRDSLQSAVHSVVGVSQTCSGCGGCERVSERISLQMTDGGQLRPVVSAASPDGPHDPRQAKNEAALFKRICPGRVVNLPREENRKFHPVMGEYVASFAGESTDPRVRFEGSSAGVLTALSGWLIESGRVGGALTAASSASSPRHTVPIRIMSREDALASSGSRYAPVAMAGRSDLRREDAFVGKPCEVAALREFERQTNDGASERPFLSFFCAGTPSQHDTDRLIEFLGGTPSRVSQLRYRGRGAPGNFEFTDDKISARLSYSESWGVHLGRNLPWRCKLCPDGTGGVADIAVGDYWEADSAGFPVLGETAGTSVVLARTHRGLAWLRAAEADGVLSLRELELDRVAATQPLQSERKHSLFWRLAGRLAAGRPIPRFNGFRLLRVANRTPTRILRALGGTYRRSLGTQHKTNSAS